MHMQGCYKGDIIIFSSIIIILFLDNILIHGHVIGDPTNSLNNFGVFYFKAYIGFNFFHENMCASKIEVFSIHKKTNHMRL